MTAVVHRPCFIGIKRRDFRCFILTKVHTATAIDSAIKSWRKLLPETVSKNPFVELHHYCLQIYTVISVLQKPASVWTSIPYQWILLGFELSLIPHCPLKKYKILDFSVGENLIFMTFYHYLHAEGLKPTVADLSIT